MIRPKNRSNRAGGVYIAVLGSALVISLLGITALIGQRIQSRIVTASSDIRQAQLNAATAVELGLLKMKTDSNWRSQLDAQSYLIKNRGLLSGGGATCSLQVFDAPSDATENADKPVKFVAIGRRGAATGDLPRTTAEQRMELVVEPRRIPHDCLKSGSSATPTWQTIFDYYGGPPGFGTKIELSTLPNRAPPQGNSFARNVSLTLDDDHWYRADVVSLGAPEFASSTVEREPDIGSPLHQWCLEVRRSSRKGGAANRLKDSLLKPNTTYNVDVEIYALLGNSFKAYLVTHTAGGTIQVTAGNNSQSISLTDSLTWQSRSFTVTTPAWTAQPQDVYLAINTDVTGGTILDFYVDNIDVYETGAEFIYQTVIGVTPNPNGLYWIDCQGTTKLVIERVRIFGTLLVLNPGPGSCVDYGPIHMSPAVPGYPALLVSNAGGNAFAIRPTPDPTSNPVDDDLTETENNVNFNPSSAPHKTHGTDTDNSDKYDSEIRGLVVVSGNLMYANGPTIRGKVLVGGTDTGAPLIPEYPPDSLLNPPPPLGGFFSYRYDRRPASVRKNVLP